MDHLLVVIHNFWILLQHGQLPQIGRWNYLLLSAVVAVEGPIATLLGAGAASAGLMRPWGVFLAAAFGNLTADTLWYMAGYSGRIDAAYKIGRWMGVRRNFVEHLTVAMRNHGVKILFFAKLTAGFMIPSLLAAGLAHLPWKKWFPILMIGEMIWTGLLVVIGYYATESIKMVSKDITYLVVAGSILFLIFVIREGRRILYHTQEFSEVIHSEDGHESKT